MLRVLEARGMGDRPHGLSQGPACVLHMPGLVCAVENPCKQRRDDLIDAPTAAREQGLQPYGKVSPAFGARRLPKGNEGKRVSSGYNRRRRLATRSSGKQQAERTAVRTAPIVCPEESPLARPQGQASFSRWGLTRRLRRGRWACSPMGRSHFSFDGERKVCKRKLAARRLLRPAPLCVAGFGLREPFGLSSTLVRFAHPSGKKAPIAHFDGGARNVARNGAG